MTMATLNDVSAIFITSANYITNVAPPIILDLNGDGIHLLANNESKVSWDLNHNGVQQTMGWVAPEDGILVYDYNGDRVVTNVNEFVLTSYAPGTTSDLEALKVAFDSNHDGIFDNQDVHFADFGVWQDLNSNGVVDAQEYNTLNEKGIVNIDLRGTNIDIHQDTEVSAGNIINSYVSYQNSDGSVHLAADVGLSVYSGNPVVVEAEPDLVAQPAEPVSGLIASVTSVDAGAPIPQNEVFPAQQAIDLSSLDSAHDNSIPSASSANDAPSNSLPPVDNTSTPEGEQITTMLMTNMVETQIF